MSINSTWRRIHWFMVIVCLLTLVFGSFVVTQSVPKAQAATSTTPIHSGNSWTGTDTSVGTYGDGSTSKMTFKITSITPATPGYSMEGLLNGYNPAMQIYEGTYAQMQQYWTGLQDIITQWGKSPIDRYIIYSIPHFGGGEMIEEQNGDLKGIQEDVGMGIDHKYSLTKDVSSPVKPGGLWVYPNNKFNLVQGNSYTLVVKGYKTTSTDPAIAYVNVTGYWSNAWHVICHIPNNRPDLGDYYYCTTNLKLSGKYPPAGALKLSFDVYDIKGNANLAPNGTPTGTFSTKGAMVGLPTYYPKPTSTVSTTGEIDPVIVEYLQCWADVVGTKTVKVVGLAGRLFWTMRTAYAVYGIGKTMYSIYRDIKSGKYIAVLVDLGAQIIPGASCIQVIIDTTKARPAY